MDSISLFRYERLEEVRLETLEEGKLWLSKTRTFNDPFDGDENTGFLQINGPFRASSVKAALKLLYNDVASNSSTFRHNNDWIVQQSIIDLISQWADVQDSHYTSSDDFDFHRRIQLSILENASNTKVSCFSRNGFSDVLLWAHYSDNHTGYCVEYEVDRDMVKYKSKGDYTISPASYELITPQYSIEEVLFTPHIFSEKFVLSKSHHWTYENEYRLVCKANWLNDSVDGEAIGLPDGMKVKAIYSGLRCSHDSRLFKVSKSLDVPLFKVRKVSSQKELMAEDEIFIVDEKKYIVKDSPFD